MERFYREIARGATVDRALQRAKLDPIRRGAPPRDWVAFTLVGDPAVTVVLQQPQSHAPLYAVLLALALGGTGVSLRRYWIRARVRV